MIFFIFLLTFICLFEFNLLSCIFHLTLLLLVTVENFHSANHTKLPWWNLPSKLYDVWIGKLIGKKKSKLTLLKFIKPTTFIVMWWDRKNSIFILASTHSIGNFHPTHTQQDHRVHFDVKHSGTPNWFNMCTKEKSCRGNIPLFACDTNISLEREENHHTPKFTAHSQRPHIPPVAQAVRIC